MFEEDEPNIVEVEQLPMIENSPPLTSYSQNKSRRIKQRLQKTGLLFL